MLRDARYCERQKRNRGGGRLCSFAATLPLASRNDTSKGGAFSMSEYTQVGVRTQAQPCTHLNQPWPSVWGEIPIIEPNEGYGRIIQTPLRPIKFFCNCAARRLSAEALLRPSRGLIGKFVRVEAPPGALRTILVPPLS